MPPRLPLRPMAGRAASSSSSLSLAKQHTNPSSRAAVCLFCSLSTPPAPSRTTTGRTHTAVAAAASRKAWRQRRFQSTDAAPPQTAPSTNPRAELIDTLLELQKHAVNHVNLSRLQLALQNLRQDPGQEAVRVAVLALANAAEPGRAAKDLLRLILADPLGDEADWEGELARHDAAHPLVVRIGREHAGQSCDEPAPTVTISKTNLLHELDVSSPALNGHSIELLLMEVNPFAAAPGETAQAQNMEESILVPTVDIPSNTGRYTPITTPVHKALVVSEGVMGAASVASLPLAEYRETVLAAIDLPGYPVEDAKVPFQPIDVSVGTKGLDLIRQSIGNAMEYERSWYKSNAPAVIQWLKSGVQSDEGQITKPAVRLLIASLLRNTLAEIEAEETRLLSGRLSTEATSSGLAVMNERLAQWSQFAHEELQQQLDLAFAGTRWRKLGWWKLFWRVDDVGALTTDMLSQRFLPGAERELIYLAGRIAESGAATAAAANEPPAYAQPTSELQRSLPESSTAAKAVTQRPKWPTHISFTRRYLHEETVPALQALAQKLVLQASSTSALTGALAGLLYVSQYASSVYEAGAVAALGVMWSLRRLQTKWETARAYWEGEVREEGRKAVRGVEQSVAEALDGSREGAPVEGAEELRKARELVEKAEDALKRLK